MRPVETVPTIRLPRTGPRRWREGKVRPIPGNSPHDRLVSRGILPSFWRICDDAFSATVFPWAAKNNTGRPVCVFKGMAESIWSDMVRLQPTLGRDRTASRRSAPGPGRRTRREDHAPSHRPQMSSGRLFLDRGARQHCPSPLHRRPQNNMHFSNGPGKGDISTLHKRVTFLLCVDSRKTTPCYQRDPVVLEGNPSLTVGAPIRAPSVSERVASSSVFHEVSRAERPSQQARRRSIAT